MWQQSKVTFRDILNSEETFPLSLVQNYYFGIFQSSVVFGDCLQTVKYANILSPVAPSCMTEDFCCYVSLQSPKSTILDQAMLANG